MLKLKDFLNEVFYIIFPKLCCYCGLVSDKYICTRCLSSLKRALTNHSNSYCNYIYSLYRYTPVLDSFFIKLKYKHYHDYFKDLHTLFEYSDIYKKIDFTKINIITFVPTTSKRLRWRGFNQSEKIAEYISQDKNIPFVKLLNKVVDTKPQIELSKNEREKNLKGVFITNKKINEETKEQIILQNSNILLIDDVSSTGTTLSECAKTIKQRYKKCKVYGLVIAQS